MLEDAVAGWITAQVHDERAKRDLTATFYSAAANNRGLSLQIGGGLLHDGRPRWVELCDGQMHLFELDERQANRLGLRPNELRERKRDWPAMHADPRADRPVRLERVELEGPDNAGGSAGSGRLRFASSLSPHDRSVAMADWALSVLLEQEDRWHWLFSYLPGPWLGEAEKRFRTKPLHERLSGQSVPTVVFAELRAPPVQQDVGNDPGAAAHLAAGGTFGGSDVQSQPMQGPDPTGWSAVSNLCPLLVDPVT